MYHLLYEKEFFLCCRPSNFKSPSMTSGHNATYAKRSCNLANSLIDYARFTKYSVSSMILLMKYRQYEVEKNVEIRIIR